MEEKPRIYTMRNTLVCQGEHRGNAEEEPFFLSVDNLEHGLYGTSVSMLMA